MRTTFITSLVLLHSLLSALSYPTTTAAERPNVLLIAIDDLRPELGCYGDDHVISPNIDRLAETGRMFERAYCQQAVCNPSRTSLMTGLRPDSIGVTGNHVHFRSKHPNVVTLSQHFMNHGYQAEAIGKIYHGVFPKGASKTVWDTMGDPESWSVPATRFGPRYYYTEEGISQAKQSFQSMYRPKNPGPDDWTKKLVFGPMTEAPEVDDETLYDGKVAAAAVRRLRSLKESDQPFFLAVGFIKPHSPFVAPKRYWDLYDPTNIEIAEQTTLPESAPAFAGHPSGEIRRYTDQPNRGVIPEENQRRMKHGYYACISATDAYVGKVLDELDAQGLADDTIVVLFGDHGYHLGEHGLWGKTTNFELDTRVPLIFRAPGMEAAGQPTRSLAELVDLYPTIAELAGLPVPEPLEGSSLKPLMSSPTAAPDNAAFSQYPRGGNADHGGKMMGYSIRTDRWRYTEWIERASGDVVASELYDHDNDPQETVNRAGRPEHEKLVAQLSRKLSAGNSRKVPGSPPPVDDAASKSISTTVFEKGDGAGTRHGYRIPALTVSNKKTILAFAERRVGLHDHAQNDIVLRRSTDLGKTFGTQIVVQEDGENVLVNPCVVTLPSGRILMMYQWFKAGYHARAGKQMKLLDPGLEGPTVSHTFVTHSDDDGLSWSIPRDVTHATKRAKVNSTATGPGIGIVLTRGEHKGRVIMPTNEGWFEG
ncbi:MAG: sulfatase-like hydrolase/transferase, partial [Bythopirellula sp.]